MRSQLKTYGAAIGAVVLALLLMLLLDSWISMTRSPFLLFFGAVTVSAWYGGREPGILATLLSAAIANYFFIHSSDRHSLSLVENSRVLAFILEGIFISILCGALRTAQRQAQQSLHQLQASEAKFRRLVESNIIGVVTANTRGAITEANDAFLNMVGYTREEVLAGRVRWDEMTPPELRHLDEPALAELSARGKHTPYEKEFFHKEGHRVPIWVGAALLEDESRENAISFILNLSDRKHTEKSLAIQSAVTRVLAEAKTLADAVPRILKSLCESLGWQVGTIWIVDRPTNVLRSIASWHAPTVDVAEFLAVNQHTQFAPGIGLPGQIWASGQSAWIADLSEDDNFPRATVATKGGLRGAFGFPIRLEAQDEILGVIECFSDRIQAPNDELLQMMASIGSQIGQFMERKRAEEELAQSQQLLLSFLNNLPGPAFIKDEEGRYLYVNPAGVRVVQRELSDIVGKTDFDLVAVEVAQQLRDNDLAVLVEGKTVELLETLPQEGGEHYWLSFKFPFQDTFGKQLLAGMSFDITARQRLEEALRESEQRYRSLVTASSQIVWRANARGQYIEVEGWEEFTGQPVEELLVQGSREAIHPDDLGWVRQAWWHAVTTKSIYEVEHRIRKYDGTYEYFAVRGVPVFDAEGQVRFWEGMSSNIHARKQAEAALQLSRERLDLVLQASELGLWYCDLPFNQLNWNDKCKEHFGLPPDAEVTIDTFYARLHPDDRERTRIAIERSLEQHSPFDIDYRTVALDGRERWIRAIGRGFYDDAGTPIRFDGITVDITHRKQIEQEREQLLTRERHYSQQLSGLTNAALAINSALSIEDVLHVITEQARAIIGTHQSVTSLTLDQNWSQAITCVSLSDKYAAWRTYNEQPDGSGIYACVCQLNRPMRMTQAELEAHPRWKGFGTASGKHPPMRGWLAAPLIGREGRNIGLIQLSDKYSGEFTAEDEAIAVQLAQMASVAIETARLYEESEQARAWAETAVAALSVSESRFRRMADDAPVFIWMSGTDGHSTYFNQPWLDFVGQRLDEALGTGWPDGIHPDDKEACLNTYRTAFDARDRFSAEYRYRRHDGEYRWLLDRGVPLLNSDGDFLGYIGSSIDISDRKRVEQAQQYLAEVGRVLASSLDYQTTLKNIAQLTVPHLADWCTVHLVAENGSVHALATAHANPEKVAWANQINQKYPYDPDAVRGTPQVLRTGQSEFYPDIPDHLLVEVARDAEHLEILREVGFKSVMIVPLLVGGRALGTIAFVAAQSGRRYDRDDLALAEELARRAALAVDNARLYQQAQQARQAAERAAERTARLQQVTAALSQALTPTQVAEVVVNQGIAALGVQAGLVTLLTDDRTEIELVESVGYPQATIDRWQRFPIDAPVPIADAVRTGEAIFLESPEALAARYPVLADAPIITGNLAFACLPLLVEDHPLGGMAFSFARAIEFNGQERAFLLTLANLCSQAIARARLYEAEQRARAQSEAANRIKDEFLAVLSHELRSPLNPILGWVRLLRSRKFDENATQRALETIERNAKLQTQLIEDLLDVSRILRGKMVLNVAPVNLVTTIEAAMETVRLAAEAKGIQIQTQLDATVGRVLGDTNRLQQVVWNLLSNAVKFTPSGGQVEVRLSMGRRGDGETGGLGDGEMGRWGDGETEGVSSLVAKASSSASHWQPGSAYARIEVMDTGKGIDPEFLPFVFDYFRQENSSTTRVFGGLGLGLAIVRHLVELHGGRVQADSPGVGQGATFSVILPLMNSEPTPTEDNRLPLDSPNLKGIRVLVVDDEKDTRELIVFILEQYGAQVTAASSGAEALSLLPQSQADILLSDIGMPEMDGYMLIRQIRAMPNQSVSEIPAIALTAYAGESDRQQVLLAGFAEHISKPVEPEQLANAIVDLVKRDRTLNP
ncbi:MAG TPA: PAS domain S-box protein [Allocoleopsis sp.]